jgi:hypothetical protein
MPHVFGEIQDGHAAAPKFTLDGVAVGQRRGDRVLRTWGRVGDGWVPCETSTVSTEHQDAEGGEPLRVTSGELVDMSPLWLDTAK